MLDTIKPYTAPDSATLGELLSCYGHVVRRSPLWLDNAIAPDLRSDPLAHIRAAFDAIEARISAEREAILKRPRRRALKPAVSPSWIQTTRRPERQRPHMYRALREGFSTVTRKGA
jgi:hypothetical protein